MTRTDTADRVLSKVPTSNDAKNILSFDSTTVNANDVDKENISDTGRQKLVVWQGIALLTADCMGVGILGLPNDMQLLGWAIGLSFLALNCPINYYAGNLLATISLDIEKKDNVTIIDVGANTKEVELAAVVKTGKIESLESGRPTIRRRFSDKRRSYKGLAQNQFDEGMMDEVDDCNLDEEYDIVLSSNNDDECSEGDFRDEIIQDDGGSRKEDNGNAVSQSPTKNENDEDKETSDLINITAAVFSPNDSITSRTYIVLVKIIYYVNLFLVLGDYILVMSRSLAAFFGEENICLPTAGAVASIFMFGLCQFRTMANLGRSVSLASLVALLIVLIQCLFHHRRRSATDIPQSRNLVDEDDNDDGIWGKFSSLAGIGFAVGSQKLFLNIRHELQNREESSKVLAGSLFTYGMAYIVVVLMAGPDPPSFLFDSIPKGWGRRVAGLLLWFHVAVSYAINSQALCASLNQMLPVASTGFLSERWCIRNDDATRWFGITLVVSLSSYLVSNAIPFFKDLVALIGALTSVPLSLMLPAILYRRAKNISLLIPDKISMDSYFLLLYSFVFLIIGLIGSLSEIEEDWLSHGKPFACH